jgi:hypothetical protein
MRPSPEKASPLREAAQSAQFQGQGQGKGQSATGGQPECPRSSSRQGRPCPLQGHLVSGLLFLSLHFLAYYLGDTLILEDIPGGHPYLMSLGILGGIWTFDNPLQVGSAAVVPRALASAIGATACTWDMAGASNQADRSFPAA